MSATPTDPAVPVVHPEPGDRRPCISCDGPRDIKGSDMCIQCLADHYGEDVAAPYRDDPPSREVCKHCGLEVYKPEPTEFTQWVHRTNDDVRCMTVAAAVIQAVCHHDDGTEHPSDGTLPCPVAAAVAAVRADTAAKARALPPRSTHGHHGQLVALNDVLALIRGRS